MRSIGYICKPVGKEEMEHWYSENNTGMEILLYLGKGYVVSTSAEERRDG